MALQRLQKGTYSDRGDRLGWSYWDTIVLDHVTTLFRMFQVPWSGAKTKDLTNMKTSGQVPQNQRFTVTRIGIMYLAAAARTTLVPIQAFLANTICEVIINGKDASYQKSLLEMVGGMMSVENASGAANVVNQTLYNPSTGWDKLSFPIVLAAQVPFEVALTSTAASAAALDGDKVKVILKGVLIRAM